ncbi:hypothetical protein KC887_08310 [Candidatus Kaiserbacteria bacterium]|nr:hypothetical protein [Candidatus Kaiserbacteria bacterium]
MTKQSKQLAKLGADAGLVDAETPWPVLFPKIEQFQKAINQKPRANEIKTNPHAGNSKYLPISFVEMKLDEMFGGLWNWTITGTQVVANELMVWGDIEVFHPRAMIWIKRSGSAAVPIQQSKNSQITDMNAKIKNALVKNFPAAEAEALKSAAKKLGKMFGRDLNRDHEDEFFGIVDQAEKAQSVEDEINAFTNEAELKKWWNNNRQHWNNDAILNLMIERQKEISNG